MPKIILEGDWSKEEIDAIALSVKSTADNLINPQPLPEPEDLLDLLKSAGVAAFERADDPCGEVPDWSAYEGDRTLAKGKIGELKYNPKTGQYLRLNANNRWERARDTSTQNEQVKLDTSQSGGSLGKFNFPYIDGAFGYGVYFPVEEGLSGALRLRVVLDVQQGEVLTDEEFFELENDLTSDVRLILDARGVKAIARTEGDRITELMIRDRSDIIPMGIVRGEVPDSQELEFAIAAISSEPDRLVVDVEMLDASDRDLTKSAKRDRKKTFLSKTHLNGAKISTSDRPALDRLMVKKAIARCEQDGVDFRGIEVRLVEGYPDFLDVMPPPVAFCLPVDRAICLCPHDPMTEINRMVKRLGDRLDKALAAGAVSGHDAIAVMQRAAGLSADWWIEMLIKRFAGAIAAYHLDLSGYIDLCHGRGLRHWANQARLWECAGDDYRCAIDPSGVPNLVTLEWDLAVPGLARMCQQWMLNETTNV